MTKEKLKPCPFCNSTHLSVRKDPEYKGLFFISCFTDRCPMSVNSWDWRMNKQQAISAWNNRIKG